ncbi:MAG: fumarate hydratase [Halobacteriota archaeon]|nr:fumarate hydratase [Halobacteriota archaeon]
MISEDLISKTTIQLLKKASTGLPSDIKDALQKGYEREEDDVPRMQLQAILDNIAIADEKSLPMCQDTGIHIFYVSLGRGEAQNVEEAIRKGVMEATKIVPLRPNAVDPLTRENPGTNVGVRMPFINYKITDKEYMEICAFPKGAGSENMSALVMLPPSMGISGIKEFALNTVVNAGGKPCPPIIMGMGIGGSADISMKLAKEALLRPIDKRHADKDVATLEGELLDALNDTGIGPMGMGGKTTLLGVNIEKAYCHTASLPVAINIQCWAARRASARLYPDGKVEYLD